MEENKNTLGLKLYAKMVMLGLHEKETGLIYDQLVTEIQKYNEPRKTTYHIVLDELEIEAVVLADYLDISYSEIDCIEINPSSSYTYDYAKSTYFVGDDWNRKMYCEEVVENMVESEIESIDMPEQYKKYMCQENMVMDRMNNLSIIDTISCDGSEGGYINGLYIHKVS